MAPERSYDAAIDQLSAALKSGIHPSLDGIGELCTALGEPQNAFRCMQVAGTNGKTSTARIAEAALRSQGLRTALYTSPELERMPERMEVAGAVVSDERFAHAVWRALEAGEQLRPGTLGTEHGFTEFELVTAAALALFAEEGVEAAVLEVGLGGRWDATSIVSPAVAVVTGIGFDHMDLLGDTLEKIAAEKAAIIKPGTSAVIGPGTVGVEHVFVSRAEAVGVPLYAVREGAGPSPVPDGATVRFTTAQHDPPAGPRRTVDCRTPLGSYERLPLPGPSYQAANVATAVAAAEALLGHPLAAGPLHKSLSAVSLPGRFERLSREPVVIGDGSHNPQAAAVLAAAIAEEFGDERPTVLLGVLADKDARGIVESLAPAAGEFVVTAPVSPRALPAAQLAAVVEEVTGIRPATYGSVAEALSGFVGRVAVPVVATGSLRVAAEARAHLRSGLATSNG